MIFTEAVKATGAEMSRLRQQPIHRYCYVCGHELVPYLRICDKCGTIQRPVGGDGIPIPPDQMGVCEYCGMPVLAEDRYCTDCLQKEPEWPPGPILLETDGPSKKAKVTAAACGSVSLAAIGASIIAMLVIGASTVFIVILSSAGVVLVISAGSLIRGARQPRNIIEVYKPILPEDKQ